MNNSPMTSEVEAIGRMPFVGNIVPHMFYKTIVGPNGKPKMNAILILSDILYWYRPKEVRDQATGAFKGYSKKFKGDLLQRSYKQISEQFNISKRAATDAIVFLEKLGAIERVFRNQTVSYDTPAGKVYTNINNVLYIKINPERIKELMDPNNYYSTEHDPNEEYEEFEDCEETDFVEPENFLPNNEQNFDADLPQNGVQSVCTNQQKGSPEKSADKYREYININLYTENINNNKKSETQNSLSSQETLKPTAKPVTVPWNVEKVEETPVEEIQENSCVDGNEDYFLEVQKALNKEFPMEQTFKTEAYCLKESEIIRRVFKNKENEGLLGRILKAFRNNDFREFLQSRKAPTVGQVLSANCWQKFSCDSIWL